MTDKTILIEEIMKLLPLASWAVLRFVFLLLVS